MELNEIYGILLALCSYNSFIDKYELQCKKGNFLQTFGNLSLGNDDDNRSVWVH